jgi:hypothetical protein
MSVTEEYGLWQSVNICKVEVFFGVGNVFHLERKRANRNNNHFYMMQLSFLTQKNVRVTNYYCLLR